MRLRDVKREKVVGGEGWRRDREIYSEGGRMFSVWLINSVDVIRGME